MRLFTTLFVAETQSIIGDQLARIALSVLVLDSTGSIVATALTYAATFLPAIAGGLLFADIGDRRQYRAVMIGSEVFRAAAFGAMAIPAMPLPIVVGLLVVAVAVGPVFTASEVSWLAHALNGELFRAATGLRVISNQAAQVAGFALGGALVALLSPRGALLINAATYVLSAVLIACFPSGRRPHDDAAPENQRERTGLAPKRRLLWTDLRLRLLMALSMLAGFFVVPEGLAIPVGRAIHASTVQTGLLLAAIPLGGALGVAVLVQWVPPSRRSVISRWMAALAGIPLLATVLEPDWTVLTVLWAISGMFAAYQIEVTTNLVRLLPERARARLVGVIGACLLFAQGAGILAFGVVARWTGAAAAVALAGMIGCACALLLRQCLARLDSNDLRDRAALLATN